MSMRVFKIMLLLLVGTSLCFGQASKAPSQTTRTDYQAQLQALSTTVEGQVSALEAEVAAAQPQDREELQRQIVETKKQGEISRLEILLQWAQERGDAARVAEIQTALDNWRNPPQPQQLPQIEKNPSPQPAPQPVNNASGK